MVWCTVCPQVRCAQPPPRESDIAKASSLGESPQQPWNHKLSQSEPIDNCGLGTALWPMSSTGKPVGHVLPTAFSHCLPQERPPLPLPALAIDACCLPISTSASSHCGTWYFGIDPRKRLPKLSPTCLMCRENASSGARQWSTKWSNMTKGF